MQQKTLQKKNQVLTPSLNSYFSNSPITLPAQINLHNLQRKQKSQKTTPVSLHGKQNVSESRKPCEISARVTKRHFNWSCHAEIRSRLKIQPYSKDLSKNSVKNLNLFRQLLSKRRHQIEKQHQHYLKNFWIGREPDVPKIKVIKRLQPIQKMLPNNFDLILEQHCHSIGTSEDKKIKKKAQNCFVVELKYGPIRHTSNQKQNLGLKTQQKASLPLMRNRDCNISKDHQNNDNRGYFELTYRQNKQKTNKIL